MRCAILRALEANSGRCLDTAEECARVLEDVLEAVAFTPEARTVRVALGDDPAAWVVRVVGANGADQHRLHAAAYALAGGTAVDTWVDRRKGRR